MSGSGVDTYGGVDTIGTSMSGRWSTASAEWWAPSLSPQTNRRIGGWSPGCGRKEGWFRVGVEGCSSYSAGL